MIVFSASSIFPFPIRLADTWVRCYTLVLFFRFLSFIFPIHMADKWVRRYH